MSDNTFFVVDAYDSDPIPVADRMSEERAFLSPCFPCNPRPFALRLEAIVAERGSAAIRSDDAKALLWVLMAQAYGELARIDLFTEWCRLKDAVEASDNKEKPSALPTPFGLTPDNLKKVT